MSSSEYHPALSSLSWLFGAWESVEAVVCYPTMTTLKYKEVLEFQPSIEPLLEYVSDTWHPERNTKLHCEKGFLRKDPESTKAALLVAHHFGLVEISEGDVEDETLCLESKSLSLMSFCNCLVNTKIVRKWYMNEGDLCSTVSMETTEHPLQKHLEVRYKRKN